MSNENPLLTEINLFRPLVRNLHNEGFVRLNDLRHLTKGEICRRVSGPGIKRLWDALGWDYAGKGKPPRKKPVKPTAG